MDVEKAKVLDACYGGRSFWFDKNDGRRMKKNNYKYSSVSIHCYNKDTGDFVKTITDDLYSNGKFGIWKKVESFGIIERVEETR